MFDFDGVLADTEPVHWACWRDLLAPLGIPVSWEFYQKNCVGVADEALFESVFHLPNVDIAALVARKRSIFRDALEASPPFHASTLECVEELRTRFQLAVVSSSARTEVEPPLIRAGIRESFRLVITGDDVEHVKPAPEPYLKAAAALEARRPLVIEDSASGIASAKAAGFEIVEIAAPSTVASQVRAALRRTAHPKD